MKKEKKSVQCVGYPLRSIIMSDVSQAVEGKLAIVLLLNTSIFQCFILGGVYQIVDADDLALVCCIVVPIPWSMLDNLTVDMELDGLTFTLTLVLSVQPDLLILVEGLPDEDLHASGDILLLVPT